MFPIFVVSRQVKCASEGEAHRTQARQTGTRHEDSCPWMREQEHCADASAINVEYVGENQQSDEFIASDLARRRGQDE